MTIELKSQLAAALAIDPSAILNYAPSPKGGGYTVILTNYQKHNNIEPVREPASPESAAQVEEESANTADPNPHSAIEIPHFELPDDLQLAFTKPHRVPREALRRLCDHLGIPYTSKNRKTQLVTKINTWKQDHATED